MTNILATLLLIVNMTGNVVNLHDDPQLIRCTCYTADEDAITASGQTVREGIVAFKPEYVGKYTCIIYENDNGEVGKIIDVFEVQDTGGELIKSGERIDVYRDSLEGCYDWISEYGDYVFIQIIPTVG